MLINGRAIAGKIYEELKKEITNMDIKPSLGAILVGDNSSSLRYIAQKKKWADYIGINFVLKKLSENISEKDLLKEIENFNLDKNIDAYMIQLPLPKSINETNIINLIDPLKDADGFHPENQGKLMIGDSSGFISCTPAGIMEILKTTHKSLVGKQIVVIGRSNIVGKPIVNLLINAGATVVNCNSKTPDIKKFTLEADIVISATGVPGLLTADMLNKDTTVIDVGFTVIDGKIYGDAETKSIDEAGINITPVPGGVGALTVAMLMTNSVFASKLI